MQWKRIFALAKKTGDRVIVTDPNGEDAFVLMNLDQYERLLGETDVFDTQEEELYEDEMTEQDWEEYEKALRDWRNGGGMREVLEEFPEEAEEEEGEEEESGDIWEMMAEAGSLGETWDTEQMSDSELKGLEHQFDDWQSKKQKKTEDKPKNPDVSEPVLEPVGETMPDDDDFGEERFYLEPVE